MSTPDTPNQVDAVDNILALIKYEVEYADTHGGCPPAIKAIHRSGLAEAKAKLNALLVAARLDEISLIKNARHTSEHIERRIKDLEKQREEL